MKLRFAALLKASLFAVLQMHSSSAYLYPISFGDELPGIRAPLGSLWPQAKSSYVTERFFLLDVPNFNVSLGKGSQDVSVTEWVTQHYQNLIRDLKSTRKVSREIRAEQLISSLMIEFRGLTSTHFKDIEAYNLTVINGSAMLVTNGDLGVIRGLETFYQLVWSPDDEGIEFRVNETVIMDVPRFPHRGVMVDTARHFIPVETLLTILTGMMYNKFNIFHWHIIDDQSFPFVSTKFPELSNKGAYNKWEIYSPEVVASIQEAAHLRGIRVIFEFDTPGHVHSIGYSHPELLTPCYGDGINPGTVKLGSYAAYENLDPSNEFVYDFMKDLFTEIKSRYKYNESSIHLGMDEVYPGCWADSPRIQEFMIQHNLTAVQQVQGYYAQRHIDMVKNLGLQPIAWQDMLDENVQVDRAVTIQVWKDWGTPWNVVMNSFLRDGYKVLFSACWYLNYINYGQSWRTYYECDPINNLNVPVELQANVLGGEAAIWAEYVDETNIIPRLFPFSGAIAEVLWTDRDREDTDTATWRLDNFRCTLVKRGIAAQPLLNGHCGAYVAEMAEMAEMMSDNSAPVSLSSSVTFLLLSITFLMHTYRMFVI